MQFIKQHFFKLTTLAAVCLLIGAQGGSWVKAEENEKIDASSAESIQLMSREHLPESPNLPNIPNATCMSNLQEWDGGSTIYDGSNPYNNLFIVGTTPGMNTFLDINGDGLPDYIYALATSAIGSNEHTLHNRGCVYLNTGSGWQKVFACYTRTNINRSTGAIMDQQYRGDCAG